MTAVATVRSELSDLYARESAAIAQEFSATGDGRTALVRRTALVDSIVQRLWNEIILASASPGSLSKDAPDTKNFALVATGGFGRGWLFPHSDIDLLFLHSGSHAESEFKDPIRRFSQELWDLRLKLSPATRNLAECERLDPNNVEFAISLLDCRYLAGDLELFTRLREKVVPRLVGRECQSLIQNLGEITRTRHHKFGNTVFHLEPNVKDGPGGLRDYNVAQWLALISAMEKLKVWPDPNALLPVSSRRALDAALDFQMSVRCFLHFRHGRHDNTLTWEAQDEAAARKIGASIGMNDAEITNAADWMRVYFGHVRSVHRVCNQLLEEIPAAWSSLYRQFQGWRSRVASDDFSVVDGLIFLKQQPQSGVVPLRDPEMLLRLFHFMAEHGLKLSTTTEYKVEQALPALAATPPRGAELWLYLQETLVQPYAADALRAMNALRLLALLLPELKGIEALVVRDFYHRYTVDEHSFLAIEHLHRLKESKSEWDQRFAELLGELEQPELLYLSLLLHDSGKAEPGENHVEVSLRLTDSCMERLDLDPLDRETVRYLVASHLDMSAAMRRDVFDPANVKSFAEKVGTPERLKMLCLLTYADIKAVNPEAMTPWKADNLWQLYIACANYLSRSADERVHTSDGTSNLAHLRSLAPVAGKKINVLLEGLPQRYLRIHGASDVLTHAEMAARLGQDGIQLSLKQVRHWYELTLVTSDRPFLFASISGALAAWGMNIVKANAFSNAAGMVVDTFYFTDRFRTLEMNLPEWERLKNSIADVVKGEADLARMLRDRLKSEKADSTKVKIATQIEFDDECSAHSTLVQVLTQDRPGLLYRMCSLVSKHECNIEIALIETEGQMAIDILYLTSGGAKLSAERQMALAKALGEELAVK